MYPVGYDPNVFVSNPGERYKIEYIGETDEYGFVNLVEVGKTDLVELHNRDASLNDVNVLYERFCNGDVTALSQVQGSYIDTFGMPKDLREMYTTLQSFERAYDTLSPELKSKYSFEEFLENAGSQQWINDFINNNNKNVENESISNDE